MAKTKPAARTRPHPPPDDSPTPLLTVHDPEYAFQAIEHIGTILSGYTMDDCETDAIQGIGYLLENLADAGQKSLHTPGRKGAA